MTRSRALRIGGSALLFVVAVAAASWWFTTADERMIKDRVLQALSDPDSAEFKDVAYFKKHDAGCGFVNARNKMGGMVGFRVFIALPDGAVQIAPDVSDPRHAKWVDMLLTYCSDVEDVGAGGKIPPSTK